MSFVSLNESSLWLLGLYLLLILLLALEGGYRLGVWQEKRGRGYKQQSSGDLVQSAMLAILGLMMAFTYGASVSRYEARKSAVIEEANVLGTAFNMAGFSGPHGRALQLAYLEYAETRVSSSGVRPDVNLNQRLERSLKAQDALYPIVQTIVEENELPPALLSQLISTLNAVLDMHTLRLAAIVDHLPAVVIYMQIFVAGVSLSVAGFNAGLAGHLSRWRMMSFACVVAAVMVVILDFDRAEEGFVKVNHTSLLNTIADMKQRLAVPGP